MRATLLHMLTVKEWNIIGLVLSMLGVLLLFRFGTAYRLRPFEGSILITESAPHDPIDTVYSVLGWLGLALIIAGTLFQIAGAYLS